MDFWCHLLFLQSVDPNAPRLIERVTRRAAVMEKRRGADGKAKWHLPVTRSKWRGLTWAQWATEWIYVQTSFEVASVTLPCQFRENSICWHQLVETVIGLLKRPICECSRASLWLWSHICIYSPASAVFSTPSALKLAFLIKYLRED